MITVNTMPLASLELCILCAEGVEVGSSLFMILEAVKPDNLVNNNKKKKSYRARFINLSMTIFQSILNL